ncbi:hypothetical protein [Nocardia sp. NPDC047038]|uniref:hypothetical protein n=1 Tax=Nocardia sp. NPDC047038 TaxID=3154338 RepID=UPI0033D84BD2
MKVDMAEPRQIRDDITTPTEEVAVLMQSADELAAGLAGAPRSHGDRPDRG